MPPKTTPNSREGIEEIVTKMLAIGWDSKMKKHDGTSIVVSFTKAELVDLLLNIEETHHQELQKAREEEREETREILRCISRMVEINATNLENYILGQMPVVQSELDQPITNEDNLK